MTAECNWPLVVDPDCPECDEWEARVQENVDRYIQTAQERRGKKKGGGE